jgi:hypothetical protein
MQPSPRYRPSKYAYAAPSSGSPLQRGLWLFRRASCLEGLRRLPFRQCRIALIETPHICAFSRSRTPHQDRINAVATVWSGYIEPLLPMGLTISAVQCLVPRAGFEPARPFGQMLLRHSCLPFHHPGLFHDLLTLSYFHLLRVTSCPSGNPGPRRHRYRMAAGGPSVNVPGFR